MERPRAQRETPVDEYDHEISQAQADIIAFADELLKHKPEGSALTFVDIVLQGDSQQMLEELQQGPLGHLLASPDDNLAMESDGSHYPILDVRKRNASLTGIALRAWGWDYDKIRYTDPTQENPPYDYKEYPGEKDKSRQLEISMGWRAGKSHDNYATESISVSTYAAYLGDISASSQISMPVYAETGYEGHGGKYEKNVSDEAAEWFLDFIARYVGDQPKSYHELIDEQLEAVRADAERNGVVRAIDSLIRGTWTSQALMMMKKPCRLLDGKTIAEGVQSPETAKTAAKAARLLLKQWKDRSFVTEETPWVIRWKAEEDENE